MRVSRSPTLQRAPAIPAPVDRRNDYGFTAGGPAWIPKLYNGHNKTFFFFNFEQFREHNTINNQLETVPTAAYRQGNFSAAMIGNPIGTDPLGRPIYQNEVYDPNTQRTASTGQVVRDPFPNNTIPLARFDPDRGENPESVPGAARA